MKLSKLLKFLLNPFMFSVVETTDDGDVIGTGNDARLKLFNQIADNADKVRGEEFYEEDESGNRSSFSGTPAEEENEEENEGTHEPDEEVEESDEKPLVETKTENNPEQPLTTPPTKYKITVNGKQKEVTIEEALTLAQKVESADDYLREAAKLHENTKSLRTPPEATPSSKVTELDDVTLARQLQMGSEEEAAAAIRSLRQPSGPSTDDLGRTIDERLNFQNSVAWFQKEYKDIVSDPLLAQLAINQDNILRQKGDQRSYVERYKEIGDSIRGWVASKAPQPEVKEERETTTEVPATKKQRKAAAPSVPKSAGMKVTVPEGDEEEESVSDTIANMAKSRGGPQWLRS